MTALLKPCGLRCKKLRARATLTFMFFNQMAKSLILRHNVTNSLALFNRTLLHYNFPSSITVIAQNQSNPLRLHPLEALSIQVLPQIKLKTQILDGDFNTYKAKSKKIGSKATIIKAKRHRKIAIKIKEKEEIGQA